MPGKKDNSRPSRLDTIQNPSEDQLEEAMEEASKLVKLVDPENRKVDKKTPHKILPGVGKSTGELIMSITALRIQNLRDVDIGKQLGVSQPYISQIESRYPEAFIKAQVIALDNAMVKANLGILKVRAALLDAGPSMVKVLVDIAENDSLKENVRKDAAIATLNLLGMGSFRTTVGGKDSTVHKGAAQVFIQNVASGADVDDCKIVDAEEVEYTEDDS